MRFTCLAIGLTLWAASGAALEIEDRKIYPGAGERTLRIISTADLDVFDPYLLAFKAERPSVAIDYTVVSSSALYEEVRAGGAYDLALSSAMDLQFQLANDGLAREYQSEATASLPDWARWRDLIFAFSAEAAVVVWSTERLAGRPVPKTRQDLITLLRDNPEDFQGAIGTYDIRESGLGYLFATQEARATDAYWRMSEVMGRLDPLLYCCSGQMIDDVANGRLALAYNVLGSYAAERIARDTDGRVQILRMEDFANVMLRTAIIPKSAEEIEEAGAMIDILVRLGMREDRADWPLPPLRTTSDERGFGPIRLGPALMVYLDTLNRRSFLAEWENALEQQ